MTTATTSDSEPAWRLQDVLALVVLVGLGVGLPVVLGAVSGALLIPHNDDPSMRRVALGLFESGRLELNGWTSMTLVGQILFVQPFLWASSGGPAAFADATVSLATVGIVASYLLARRLLSVLRATVAVLGVLFFPGFLLNTTTFMTDVPAWAMSIACLALGAAALDRRGRDRWLWLIASLAVGCFAFSIREFAIAAPAAVLAVTAANETGSRRPYAIAGTIVLGICVATYVVAVHLPGQHEPPPQLMTPGALRGVGRSFATLALVLAPALVLAAAEWRRRWHIADVLFGLAVGLLVFREPAVALLRSRSSGRLILGNLLEPSGNLGSGALTGGRPLLFVPPIWHGLNVVAFLAAVGLCAIVGGTFGIYLRRAVRGLRAGRGLRELSIPIGSTKGLLALFAALYAGGVFSWGFVVIMFDRYLWLLVLPLYVLLLTRPRPTAERAESIDAVEPTASPRARRFSATADGLAIGLSGLLLAGLAATSLVLLVNADAFETARWRMGEQAVTRGFTPGTVDAGLEWVAYHATGVAAPYAKAQSGWSRYGAWWPSFRLCAVVSASPLNRPDVTLIDSDAAAYRRFLFAGQKLPLYLYRVRGTGCP